MGSICSILNTRFKQSFAFYSAYHRHPVNKLIHCVSIPLIVWTVLGFAGYYTIAGPASKDIVLRAAFRLTPGTIVAGSYWLFYLCSDFLIGLGILPFIALLYLSSTAFVGLVPLNTSLPILLFVHIVSWVIQFLGHGLWEKRKPALMESLWQAFLMAPLFVFVEFLFWLGWNPAFESEIEALAENYMPIP